jgi:hypothetical protein
MLDAFTRKIKTGLKTYEDNGLVGVINSLLRNIRIDIKLFADIDKKKEKF